MSKRKLWEFKNKQKKKEEEKNKTHKKHGSKQNPNLAKRNN